MIKYAEVQKLRKTAGYVDTLDNENLYWKMMTTQGDREKLKPFVEDAYRAGVWKGFADGQSAGKGLTREFITDGMLIGAPVGAVAGTGLSALLLRKDMSNAKKLAILLAGAGIGGVTGAGVGGVVSGLSVRG